MRISSLLLLFVLCLPGLASAQVSTEEVARRLVGEGIEAAKDRNWMVARQKFEKAYEIQPLPLTLYNLATAQEKTGDLVAANRSYRLFLRATQPGEQESFRKAATSRQVGLRRRIAHVVVEAPGLAPDDVLYLADEVVAHAMLGQPLPANPGRLGLRVERAGRTLVSESLTLTEGSSKTVRLDVPLPAPESLTSASSASPTLVAATPTAPDAGESVFESPWFWVVAGVVAAGAGAGAYFALRPSDPYSSTLDRVEITGL